MTGGPMLIREIVNMLQSEELPIGPDVNRILNEML